MSSSSELEDSNLFPKTFCFKAGDIVDDIILNRKSTHMIVATGSNLNFYEFHGMTNECSPYLFVDWKDGTFENLSYSSNYKEFIASGKKSFVRLYLSNGDLLEEFVEGDPFILDLTKTRGHVKSITGNCFHVFNKENFATASLDGTIRLWDVRKRGKSVSCIRFSNGIPSKAHAAIPVQTICILDNLICAGGNSTLKCWDYNSHTVPVIEKSVGETISYIQENPDMQHLLVQTASKLSIYDKRHMKEPILAKKSVSFTKACWSPDGQSVLHANNQTDFEIFDLLDNEVSSCFPYNHKAKKLLWSKELDQIIAGSETGELDFFYKNSALKRGIMFAASAPKLVQKEIKNVAETEGAVYLPNANPQFQVDPTELLRSKRTTQRELNRIRRSEKTATVEKPVDGAGKKGKMGTSNREAIMKKVLEKIPPLQHFDDPREATVKYAESDPLFIDKAYQKSQPVKKLHSKTVDEEIESDRKRQKK